MRNTIKSDYPTCKEKTNEAHSTYKTGNIMKGKTIGRAKKTRLVGKLTTGRMRKDANPSWRKKILSEEAYQVTMKEIDQLMRLGEKNLSDVQLKRLRVLALAAEEYEDTHHPLPLSKNLTDILQQRMFQMRINQRYAAVLLGVSDAKFSLILSGKQKPDVGFIKAVHQKLKVDANVILEAL